MTTFKGKFTPTKGCVLLAPEEDREVVDGGIIIPAMDPKTGETRVREYRTCEVLAVGKECELRPGDKVYEPRFALGEVGLFELNGRKVYLILERHLKGITVS